MYGYRTIKFVLIIFLALFLSSSFSVYLVQMSDVSSFNSINLGDFFPLDKERILQHIIFFANLGSRMTGYPGSYVASQYIAQKFREFGLKVLVHKYKVLVPVEKKVFLEVLSGNYAGQIIRGHALYPNLIQTCNTPPEGVSGNLIILKKSGLEEIDGKKIEGSICMMEFNTGQDWLKLAELGARAVVFIEPYSTNFAESMCKFTCAPLNLPRVYISREDALFLERALEEDPNLVVKLFVKMDYEWVEAENVIGILEGVTPDIILVSAHYDSWSIVPSISPAAEESISIAALIEMARHFSKQSPYWSIWFVAFSGKWQALAGAREFVEDFIFSNRSEISKSRIWMCMNLDLSTGSDRLSVVFTSHFYRLNIEFTWENWFKTRLKRYLIDLDTYLGSRLSSHVDIAQSSGWWARVPSPYMTNSDPIAATGLPSFTLITSDDMRFYWGTPINDVEKINFSNLMTQLLISHYVLSRFANEENWGISWESISPQKFLVGGVGGRLSGSGFVTLQGKVVEYNLTKGWFETVPNALITIHSSRTRYPFATIITKCDDRGMFSVHGLLPYFVTSPSTGYNIYAWVLNQSYSYIEYANNYGLYGREINMPVLASSPIMNKTVAVFRCKSIALFGIYDPKTFMKTYVNDNRDSSSVFSYIPTRILLLEFASGAECLWHGGFYTGYEPLAMIFVKPDERFTIKIEYGAPVKTYVFLINASLEHPEGYGYTLEKLYELRLSVPVQSAFDIYRVTVTRYSSASSLLLRNPSVEECLKNAEEHLMRYTQYISQNLYSKAYGEILVAWVLSIESYELLMNLIYESSTTISVMVALIIPAAIFIERLLMKTAGYKRLLSSFLTMAIMFTLFGLTFPGFKIMQLKGNPLILIMTVPLFYLLVFSFLLLLRVSSKAIRRQREEKLGVHEKTKDIISFALYSFTVSLGYLKRRRFRTLMILLTVIITSLSLTSLASLSPRMTTRLVTLSGITPAYEGFLFKRYDPTSFSVIDEPLIDYLKGVFGKDAKICPRVWVYPQVTLPQGELISLVQSEHGSIRMEAFVGLSEYEMATLFKGGLFGMLLSDEDNFACLIPQWLSNALNVTLGDKISWNNIQFIIKGIFDERVIGQDVDLDGYSLSPFDPLTVPAISRLPAQQDAVPRFTALYNTIILHYKTALKLGGVLMSVKVQPQEKQSDFFDKNNVLSLLEIKAFIGTKDSVFMISRTSIYEFIGIESMIALAFLASFNICATMLGVINERKKEIFIHSALGLDPKSSSLLFLFEILALSISGATLGYLVGINLNYLLIFHNLLPKTFTFNYSSFSASIIIAILLSLSIVSTLYPAIIASKIVTPSHERRWRMPTKPKGDEWEIPMPFTLQKSEVPGIFRFLGEYYESLGEEKTKTFIVRGKAQINLQSESPSISFIVALAPFEANITQLFSLVAIPIDNEKYTFKVLLKQLTGIKSKKAWISSNYSFIDSLRKQFLIWRSFSESEKKKYYN